MHRLRLFRLFHVLICLGLWSGAVQALTASEASAIAVGETDARLEALAKAVATADDRTAAFIQALADDAVKVSGGRVFIVRDGKGVDPLTGLGIAVPADAEDVVSNNRMRGELDNAMAALKLFSKDDKLRLQGVKALLKEPDEARLPLVEKALAAEKNETIRTQLELARAAALLGSSDKDRRLEAARAMGQSKTPETKLLLNERMKAEADPAVKAQLEASLRAIEGALAWGDKLGALFSGISLGSMLLLVALGLAITYGPDGRDQHGAWRADDDRRLCHLASCNRPVPASFFRAPSMTMYLLAAVPVAFMAVGRWSAWRSSAASSASSMAGRSRRLLATWGISLILMQVIARSLFGAQNVAVENPSWLSRRAGRCCPT
jgi:urea transport system permease protein